MPSICAKNVHNQCEHSGKNSVHSYTTTARMYANQLVSWVKVWFRPRFTTSISALLYTGIFSYFHLFNSGFSPLSTAPITIPTKLIKERN